MRCAHGRCARIGSRRRGGEEAGRRPLAGARGYPGNFTLSRRKAARCSRDQPRILPQIQDPTEVNLRIPESAGIVFIIFSGYTKGWKSNGSGGKRERAGFTVMRGSSSAKTSRFPLRFARALERGRLGRPLAGARGYTLKWAGGYLRRPVRSESTEIFPGPGVSVAEKLSESSRLEEVLRTISLFGTEFVMSSIAPGWLKTQP